MSVIMKFWVVSGMILWTGVLACFLAVASQWIVEALARGRKERE